MVQNASDDRAALTQAFSEALRECEQLYRDAAVEYIQAHPRMTKPSPQEFLDRMADLHRGLLAKIFITLAQADRRYSKAECELAGELVAHLWGRRLANEELRPAVTQLSESSMRLSWESLVGPFQRLRPLKSRVAELEALVLRIANLVAKIDGGIRGDEQHQLNGIQHELERCLVPLPLPADDPSGSTAKATEIRAYERLTNDSEQIRQRIKPDKKLPAAAPVPSKEQQLAEALVDLNKLIGLKTIKQDVRELASFLKMQQERQRLGLPQTQVSLHMVFSGNPGTGKTTVARIIGRIFGAMGVLSKGHLVETDRSGLVAKYAGQTAPQTHKKVDEALDGILFIDEAYSLVAEQGDDAYGAEAISALLKRMEDDRHRLVVILAGYPGPMADLLRSNPGLSSRFNRRLEFPDYSVIELGQILLGMCERDHYELPPATRGRLLCGFQYLLDRRDEHFGNGRLVRNIFESAIRKLATRITGQSPLTRELLTRLEPADILFPEIDEAEFSRLNSEATRFQVTCSGCRRLHRTTQEYLGQQVRCKDCGHRFLADWGQPVWV